VFEGPDLTGKMRRIHGPGTFAADRAGQPLGPIGSLVIGPEASAQFLAPGAGGAPGGRKRSVDRPANDPAAGEPIVGQSLTGGRIVAQVPDSLAGLKAVVLRIESSILRGSVKAARGAKSERRPEADARAGESANGNR
jgi:hypothetical protein